MFYALTCLTSLLAFVPLLRTCLYFFTCLTCLHIFTCLTCLYFFTCLDFLCVYILFMYTLIKLIQINELAYDFSSLLLLNSVSYRLLSSIFTSIKLLPFSAWFFLLLKQPFEILEHYLKRESQEMLKSFTIRHNKKIQWNLYMTDTP